MLADNVKVCGHAESILCDCLTGIDVPRIVKEVMEPLGDKLQMMEQVSKGWLSLGGNEVVRLINSLRWLIEERERLLKLIAEKDKCNLQAWEESAKAKKYNGVLIRKVERLERDINELRDLNCNITEDYRTLLEQSKEKIGQQVKETWTETNNRTNEPLKEQGKSAVEMVMPNDEQIEQLKVKLSKFDPKKLIVIEEKFETFQQQVPGVRVTHAGGNRYQVEVQFTKPCEVEFSVSLKKE